MQYCEIIIRIYKSRSLCKAFSGNMTLYSFHVLIPVGVILIILINQGNALLLPSQVNCGEVGIFKNNGEFATLPLPRCPSDAGLNVNLVLYTRDNPTDGQVITRTDIPNTFRNNRLTWFIVHGYASNESIPIYYAGPWIANMTEKALLQGDYNVIDVQWNSLNLNYFQSSSDTRTVGAQIALIAQETLVANGLPRENLYCVGHSLGAHVCSFASKTYKFGRITGLDPAGPWFDWVSPGSTPIGLGPNDADQVDVIHTDGILFGTKFLRGQIDFHPTTILNAVPLYAHEFSLDLFAYSISESKDCFHVKSAMGQCSMGFYASECTLQGNFVIYVSSIPPFCVSSR